MRPYKNKKMRNSAKGENCTLNVAGACNYNPETVVLCHINTEGGAMGAKADDYSACYGCHTCHNWLDRSEGEESDRLFYTRRALVRTWKRMIEKGLIELP